jgi:hypothetical protein
MKSQTTTTQRRGLRADLAPRIALLALDIAGDMGDWMSRRL